MELHRVGQASDPEIRIGELDLDFLEIVSEQFHLLGFPVLRFGVFDAEIGARRAIAAQRRQFGRIGTAEEPVQRLVDLVPVVAFLRLLRNEAGLHPLDMEIAASGVDNVQPLLLHILHRRLPAALHEHLATDEICDLFVVIVPERAELSGLLAFD